MSVIVRDDGFHPDDWAAGFAPPAANARSSGLALGPDAGVEALDLAGIAAIRIDFPKFSDGRGFTLARRLRALGFEGRLRAAGHVIADQYAMARRSGFDEVEIDEALAERQPEPQWLARADWRAHDYRSRLRG